MEKRSLKISTLTVAVIVLSLNICAKDKSTIILKNGTRLTGIIVSQRIGKDINIDIEEAEYVFNPSKSTITEKNVKYEELSREWQRWSIKNKALVGNAYGRTMTLCQVKTENMIYENLKCVEKDATPKIVYLQLNPGTITVDWNDIVEIKKESKRNSIIGDEIETNNGKIYKGQIVSQIFDKSMEIKTENSSVIIPLLEIKETRKVIYDENHTLMQEVDYVNSIVLVSGDVKEGIISVTHYGKKANDRYLVINKENGTTEKISMGLVTEIKTRYTATNDGMYSDGNVYINEFRIEPAKTINENGTTAYVDKSVFPFPEGIVTTFKAKSTLFIGNWKLVALELVELSNGKSTQGYNAKLLGTNLIKPSQAEYAEGISKLTFTYLAPGFYALINPDYEESYIFKIVK